MNCLGEILICSLQVQLLIASAPNADPLFVSPAASQLVRITADRIPVPSPVAMSLIVPALDKFCFSTFSPVLIACTSRNGNKKSSVPRQDLVSLDHPALGQDMEESTFRWDSIHITWHVLPVLHQIHPRQIQLNNTNEMNSFDITSAGLPSF